MRRFAPALLILLALFGALAYLRTQGASTRRAQEREADIARLREWVRDPQAFPDRWVPGGRRCGDALMLVPTAGYVGFTRGDSFGPGHQHSGLDIFSPDGEPDTTPVLAAFDGYLTREADWKSTVILRHPDLPVPEGSDSGRRDGGGNSEGDGDGIGMMAGETIWTYYTHMASAAGDRSFVSPDFPAGTRERFVAAGTVLGRQGRWSGNPGEPTGLHLHFSIVRSTLDGGYADETHLSNTLDPLPFLGLDLEEDGVVRCREEA
jgi:murein DD-endopeptidase MepM/ murein hydrolase activator NlpD